MNVSQIDCVEHLCNNIHLLVPGQAWDMQVLRVLETTLDENLKMIADTVTYFKVLHKVDRCQN